MNQKQEQQLIKSIQAFNIGWFGVPKSLWRQWGLTLSFLGAGLLILGNVVEDPASSAVATAGFFILVTSVIMVTVNG